MPVSEDVDEIDEFLKQRREKISHGELVPKLPQPGLGQRVAQAIFGKPKPRRQPLITSQPTRASSNAQGQMRQQLATMMQGSAHGTITPARPFANKNMSISPRLSSTQKNLSPGNAPLYSPIRTQGPSLLPASPLPTIPAQPPTPLQRAIASNPKPLNTPPKKPFTFAQMLPFMRPKQEMAPRGTVSPTRAILPGQKKDFPLSSTPSSSVPIIPERAPMPPSTEKDIVLQPTRVGIPTPTPTTPPSFTSPFPPPSAPASPHLKPPSTNQVVTPSKDIRSLPGKDAAPPSFAPPWKKDARGTTTNNTSKWEGFGSAEPIIAPQGNPTPYEMQEEGKKYADIPSLQVEIPRPREEKISVSPEKRTDPMAPPPLKEAHLPTQETFPPSGRRVENTPSTRNEGNSPVPQTVTPNMETGQAKPTSYLQHIDAQRQEEAPTIAPNPPVPETAPLPYKSEMDSSQEKFPIQPKGLRDPSHTPLESAPRGPRPYVPPWSVPRERLNTPEITPPPARPNKESGEVAIPPLAPKGMDDEPRPISSAPPETKSPLSPLQPKETQIPSQADEEDQENLTPADWAYLEQKEKEHEQEEKEQASIDALNQTLTRQEKQVAQAVPEEPVDDPKKEILRRLKKMIEEEHGP